MPGMFEKQRGDDWLEPGEERRVWRSKVNERGLDERGNNGQIPTATVLRILVFHQRIWHAIAEFVFLTFLL